MYEIGGGVHKFETNFYAFLDELGHSEYFLKLKKKVGKWPLTKKIPSFFSTLKASLS